MNSDGQQERVEILVPVGDDRDAGDTSAPELVATRPFGGGGRWAAVAAVVIVALTAVLWGSYDEDGLSDAPELADPQSPIGESPLVDRVAAPDLTSTDGPVGIEQRLAALDGRLLLAMASPTGITLWDLIGDQESLVPLPERPTGEGLVAVGDRLVYVGESGAWSVGEDGDGRSLGPANQVLAAGDAELVWLGSSVDDDDRVAYVDWSERSIDGVETRSARREMPLEFQAPDLVWGFNSSLFRLTENDDRPWKLISYGLPLAVGPNDLIVKACDPDCRRVWFDAATGLDRGRLLAEVSERFDGQRGWVSPDGRFVAFQAGSSAAVEVVNLGADSARSDATRQVACRSAKEVVWSTEGFLVCPTDAGVSVVDLENGGRTSVVPPADLLGIALWSVD